jgi:two-component system cell cycle response regulator
MPDPVRVAILGFSAFERSAMASYFNLGARRSPGYQCVLEADTAHFIIADADQTGVVLLLRTLGRSADAVFIGAHGPADAAAWMMRPINPVHVLRELDMLLAQRRRAAASELPAAPPVPPALARAPAGLPLTAPGLPPPARRASDDVPAALGNPGGAARSLRRDQAESSRRYRSETLGPRVLRRALLVDDSEIALQFLRRHLEPYGLECDMARTSNRALDLLTHQPYGLVFLDVDLGDDSPCDGLTLCQTIKQRLVLPGGLPPLVVMVSAFHDPVDRVRGTLAGADSYIGKPLDFGALDRLLRAQGLGRPTGALAGSLAGAGGVAGGGAPLF